MAKNKKRQKLTTRDFITTAKERMEAKLDYADTATMVVAADTDENHEDSFLDRWCRVYDKLNS